MTAPIGASLASPTARLVATVVFPTPPFGDITEITRPRTRFWLASSEAVCLRLLDVTAACSNASTHSSGLRVRCQDIADAGPHGGQRELGCRDCRQHEHNVRVSVLQACRQGEHVLRPDVGAENHDIDGTAQVAGQQMARAAASGFGGEDLDIVGISQGCGEMALELR